MFNPPTAVVPGLLRRLRVSNHGEAQKRDGVGGAALALLVDPDDANATRMGRLLNGLGFEVTRMRSGCAALGDLHLLAPRVAVVTDDVNDLPADQLVRHLQAITQTPILLLTEQPANEATAPRLGTNATLEKTASDAAVRGALEALLARSGSSPKPPLSAADFDRAQFFRVYSGLFHRSPQMREVERTALQMSTSDAPAIVRGESGVGKSSVARAVHYFSGRSVGPWVTVACFGLPPEVLPTEIPRRFALADRGTLVLEDVDQLPPDVQATVLRIIRDREVYADPPADARLIDTRIIATTTRDLESLVAAGSFRKDLYYHINVLSLTIPPLRERTEEIPGLAEYFRTAFMERYRRDCPPLSPDLLKAFTVYQWPGNVRELESVVKRYVVLGGESEILAELRTRARTINSGTWIPSAVGEGGLSLKEIGRRAAQRAETAALLSALERVNWNRAEAARLLKISYKTLLNKLNQCVRVTGRERKS
jgi:two-component system, NtrC family, response regulator AtoC